MLLILCLITIFFTYKFIKRKIFMNEILDFEIDLFQSTKNLTWGECLYHIDKLDLGVEYKKILKEKLKFLRHQA